MITLQKKTQNKFIKHLLTTFSFLLLTNGFTASKNSYYNIMMSPESSYSLYFSHGKISGIPNNKNFTFDIDNTGDQRKNSIFSKGTVTQLSLRDKENNQVPYILISSGGGKSNRGLAIDTTTFKKIFLIQCKKHKDGIAVLVMGTTEKDSDYKPYYVSVDKNGDLQNWQKGTIGSEPDIGRGSKDGFFEHRFYYLIGSSQFTVDQNRIDNF